MVSGIPVNISVDIYVTKPEKNPGPGFTSLARPKGYFPGSFSSTSALEPRCARRLLGRGAPHAKQCLPTV